MALEGNAKDFGLSEIFQLISIQKKSGMLSVSAEENVAVFFRDGLVISTRDRRNRDKDPLKDYLLRYGFLSQDEMDNLQKIQADSNLDLTDILLSEKYFSEEELKAIFADQIYESFQEILGWPKSYYKFIIGTQVLTGVRSYAALKVEGLLMESMRRIDEFPEMLRIFPSEEMFLKRLPIPPEKRACLERNEEIVYELLENERNLSSLISMAKMARFCTYEALKQLLEKGLLEITEDIKVEEEEIREKPSGRKKDPRKRAAPTLSFVTMLIISFAIGEYAVPRLMPPGWTADLFTGSAVRTAGSGTSLAENIGVLKLRRLEATLREGLEEYRASRGSYPFSIEVLVVEGIIEKSVIAGAQQHGFRYRVGERSASYTLGRT